MPRKSFSTRKPEQITVTYGFQRHLKQDACKLWLTHDASTSHRCFDAWLQGLRDQVAKKQILARLTRLSGQLGDCKSVGGEVTELRIDTGPGYRVYCWRSGEIVVIALGGGDKSTQQRDIEKLKPWCKSSRGDDMNSAAFEN
ncbi:hypothetical protein J4714_12795 [Staphylococcus epidermidis]|nr:hypothetical protein [Staphylococcus epidermidis]